METEPVINTDIIIYDILWNVLRLSNYVDIMNARFVDKKTYELTTRIDLWSGLLSRDYIFLTEFDLRQANSDPEKGYNIIRKYIFRYVQSIQKQFKNEALEVEIMSSQMDIAKSLVSCFEAMGITQLVVELHTCLTNELGLEGGDIVQVQNEIKTAFDTKSELKIGQNTLQNIFASFKNKDVGGKYSNNMNSDNILIVSRKPSVIQQSIYNSLIEWREEYISAGGRISQEIGELIIEDIFSVLNVRCNKNKTVKLADLLNQFTNDLNYGIQLHILYNTNRPTQIGNDFGTKS
jgi:hypothetical protein